MLYISDYEKVSVTNKNVSNLHNELSILISSNHNNILLVDLLFIVIFYSCLEREDVVKVHDGGSSVAPVIAVLCNELSTTELISTNNQLYIEFITGSEWPGHGFRATYQFTSVLGNFQ